MYKKCTKCHKPKLTGMKNTEWFLLEKHSYKNIHNLKKNEMYRYFDICTKHLYTVSVNMSCPPTRKTYWNILEQRFVISSNEYHFN